MSDLKQIVVASKILDNTGVSMAQAMREAGYSEGYAKNPQDLAATKSWKELMDQYIPEKLVAQKHNELLTAKKIRKIYVKGELEAQEEEVDTQAVKAGVEMAYKLRGKYAPEIHKHIFEELDKMDDKELLNLANGSTNNTTGSS